MRSNRHEHKERKVPQRALFAEKREEKGGGRRPVPARSEQKAERGNSKERGERDRERVVTADRGGGALGGRHEEPRKHGPSARGAAPDRDRGHQYREECLEHALEQVNGHWGSVPSKLQDRDEGKRQRTVELAGMKLAECPQDVPGRVGD